ncbi:MAG: alpha/beta hydrolase [Deltaproteobacteria bacterium]|nr:alpha/beta hydrolase [Deltaproteobacteria bacterium]
MASAELRTVLEMLSANPLLGERPAEEMRAGLEAMAGGFPLAPDVRVAPVRVGAMAAEWIAAPGASTDHAILYLHGGGYVVGSLNTHRELAARVGGAASARVLAIDYRLAPEHPHPAAVEDAVAAYRWLLAQGLAPERLAVAGDSAGGGLAIATLLALRDRGVALPSGGVCFSPWVDLEATGASMDTIRNDPMLSRALLLHFARFYLGDGAVDARTPLAAPLHADLRGLPPLLVQASRHEVLRDDAVRIVDKARAAGVAWELELTDEVPHVWQIFASILPEGREAIARAGTFLRGRLGTA